MRLIQAVVAVAVLGLASTSMAQNIALNAGLGYTRILNGDGVNGFGIDVFPGYNLGNGVVPELQLGFHYNSTSAEVLGIESSSTAMTIPIMLGARYELDLGGMIKPFAGAHFGISMGKASGETAGVSFDADMTTDLSFNVGAGANYAIAEGMGLGLGLWYWMILSGSSTEVAGVTIETENGQLLNVGLTFTMAL